MYTLIYVEGRKKEKEREIEEEEKKKGNYYDSSNFQFFVSRWILKYDRKRDITERELL